MPTRKNRPKVVPSSGNVFADLGITNADEKQTKARLAVAMNQIIQGRKLSQMAAARRLKVDQPKVSALSNYQLDGFSVERLMNFVTALDHDVDIVIRPKSQKIGRIALIAAYDCGPSGYELDDHTLSPTDSVALIPMRPPKTVQNIRVLDPSWTLRLG